MSILPPIMLVNGWYRLFGTLRTPETIQRNIRIKNDPRSCERNLYNCVRSLKKKIRTSTGDMETSQRLLLKGFGRSMVRIVPYGIRGVPLIVSIAIGHSGDRLITIRLFVIQPNVSVWIMWS